MPNRRDRIARAEFVPLQCHNVGILGHHVGLAVGERVWRNQEPAVWGSVLSIDDADATARIAWWDPFRPHTVEDISDLSTFHLNTYYPS